MINYTKRNVYFISFLISIIIFNSIIFLFNFLNKNYFYSNTNSQNNYNSEYSIENKEMENKNQNQNQNNMKDESFTVEWKIEIPSISLVAYISEGIESQILNELVGHFEDTSKTNGNIGLAAHNRGYKNNYFENIKKLKKEDEIIYTYGEFKKVYKVEKTIVIKDTNWSYLEQTTNNKITLITCVDNEPEYRRCVQAVEKEE